MHHALIRRVHAIQFNAKLGAVLVQRGDLLGRNLIDNVQPTLNRRRHIVIDRRDAAIRPAHLAARQAQPLKGLRRGDLVQQLQVDVQHRRLALRLNHHVLLPDLFK